MVHRVLRSFEFHAMPKPWPGGYSASQLSDKLSTACNISQKESVEIAMKRKDVQKTVLQAYEQCEEKEQSDPKVEALVTELVGRVADKWTMLIIEVLTERGEVRFTRLSEMVPGISYKMLTQTLRQMEREGLVSRTVHPVIPPKVEYRLTDLGLSLSAAFCGVWLWAAEHLMKVEKARARLRQQGHEHHWSCRERRAGENE
jgi:DNA-binding HxlR family transcriptional regulator